MKILLINDIGSEKGGAEVMVKLLKMSLIKKGHDVRILAGCEYYGERFNEYEYTSIDDSSWRRSFLYLYNLSAARQLKKILRDFKPDIVHLHITHKASPSILFLLRNTPTVMTAHDYTCVDQTAFDNIKVLHKFKDMSNGFFIKSKGVVFLAYKFKFKYIQFARRNIDIVIAPSDALAEVLMQGGINNTIITIHNGVGQPDKSYDIIYPITAVNVLFAGRIVVEKGIHVVIAAILEAKTKVPTVKLTVIGEGPELATAKFEVAQLGLANDVRFIGNVSHELMPAHFRETDLVVVPSMVFEALGLVAAEAILVGKPVIASRAGGLVEIVEDQFNGVLVDPGDSHELAVAISKLLSNPVEMKRLGLNGLKQAKEFSTGNYIDKTLTVYQDVISAYCP